MKKIIASALLFVSSLVIAEPLLVVKSADNAAGWYFYPETLQRHSDGYSIMSSKRFFTTNKDESRGYFGITTTDCKAKFGTLLVRDTEYAKWEVLGTVSFADGSVTVSDEIAANLCAAAKIRFSKTKSL